MVRDTDLPLVIEPTAFGEQPRFQQLIEDIVEVCLRILGVRREFSCRRFPAGTQCVNDGQPGLGKHLCLL
jgi:hypothetical protein